MAVGRRRALATLGGLAATALAGCSSIPTGGSGPGGADPPPAGSEYGYTHLRPDGNRVLAGSGSVPDAGPVDVPVGGSPAWLAAVPLAEGSLWAAVAGDGTAAAFRLRGGAVEEAPVEPERLPPGTPPLLAVGRGSPRLLPPPDGASTATHPIVLDDGRLLAVAPDGDLLRRGEDGVDRLAVGAPPDARLVRAGDRVAVLADATRRYGHGVLGDGIEAESVAVVDPGALAVRRRIRAEEGAVIEGIAPILADLTGDGAADAIVTETDPRRGAREVVYGIDGERIAAGAAIGNGFRWRHQVAVAPFGPDGGRELAAVRTPHIGGIVEFYRLADGALEIAATLEGYSSHAIGSRNLDGGLAGDLDGDGRVELLVPADDRRELAAVRRTDGGATEAWRLPLGGDLATNLVGVPHSDGIAVGAGRSDGVVRIWA